MSPRSDDGMSVVSRMKHNNYANVVQEMKKKQNLASGRRKGQIAGGSRNNNNVYHSHQNFASAPQSQDFRQFQRRNHNRKSHHSTPSQDWGFSDAFGDSYQQQNIEDEQFGWSSFQHHEFPQPQSKAGPSSSTLPSNESEYLSNSRARTNVVNNGFRKTQSSNNHNLQNSPDGKPGLHPIRGRPMRKLYRDQSVRDGNDEQAGASGGHVRSKSTIRRNADHARKLAERVSTFDDGSSDFGGSDIGMGSFATSSSIGSKEDDFAGFADFDGSGYFDNCSGGQRNGYPLQQRGQKTQQHQQRQVPLHHPINPSPVMLNGRSHSFADQKTPRSSIGDENGGAATPGGGSAAERRRAQATLHRNFSSPENTGNTGQAGHNTSKDTGSNMKSTPPALPPPANSASGARRNMRARMRSGNSSSFGTIPPPSGGAPHYNSSSSAKYYQKHEKSPSQSYKSGEMMFNAFGIDSYEIDDEVNMALNDLQITLPDNMDFPFERNHSTGEGSVDSSVHSGNSGPMSPPLSKNLFQTQTYQRKQNSDEGTIQTRTTKSLTDVEFSIDSNSNILDSCRQRPTEKPNVGDGEVSPVISVEQYSESSSLTDASDWHVSQQQQQQKQNIFKDASKGSTFHKSKKIVRPGDSIPEHVAQSPRKHEYEHTVAPSVSNQAVVSTGASPYVPASAPVKSMFSVNDRFSKSDSTTKESGQTVSARSPAASMQSLTPNNVKGSPFLKIANANVEGGKKNVQQSFIPTSDDPPSNPFAVKLRKTKNSPSQILGDCSQPDSLSTLKTRSSGDMGDINESKGAQTNPFLSNLKLRKTGLIQNHETASEIVANEVEEELVEKESMPEILLPEKKSVKKMTYKEERDLLRKKKEAEGQNEVVVEPRKDVAALIRERIAANKRNAVRSTPPTSSDYPEKNHFSDLRNNLKTAKTKSYSNSNYSIESVESGNDVKSTPAESLYASLPSTSFDQKSEDEAHDDFGDQNVENQNAENRKAENRIMEAEEKEECEEDDDNLDPRAALMAMLNRRARPEVEDEECAVHPKAKLTALLQSGTAQCHMSSNVPKSDESATKANLSAMLQSRVSTDTAKYEVTSDPAKNILSSIPIEKTMDTESSQHTSNEGRPILKDDPKYAKYMKMLKVGMPLPVVQHAMTRDGLDPSILEGDHDKPAPEPKLDGVPLKDDPAFAKYFKMLKLGLPMGAVKNAMERDGLDSSIMDGDHHKPASSATPDTSGAKKRQKDTHRRTRLHWDTLNKVKSNTVWALVEEDQELEEIEIDEKEFTNLFQAEIKTTSAATDRSSNTSRSVVQVIDPKRANNGGIILARLRMSYDDLAKAVENIDETAMSANQAQGIIEYMPTSEERKMLRDYMKGNNGDSAAKFETLCECEKFMVAMMTVKQSKRKLRALLFKLQFRGCIHDLAHDVFSIEKACDELSNSVRLRKLFGIVLNIGNRLNTAGPGEKRKAGAFSVKSLLKLNQAKAFDNKTTFLHFVVKVVQRNNEYLLDFKDDLPTVVKACKIFWDQCVNELEEVETQLENVRKLALHEAKTKKVVYELPSKKKPQEGNDSDDLSIVSMSLEEEVAMLRSTKIGLFALSAIKKVSQLRDRVETARNKFTRLLEYFGEDAGKSKMEPHELFEIISTFCRNFDAAREDVDRMEKAKKRDEKKTQSNQQEGVCDSSQKESNSLRSDLVPSKPKLKTVHEHRPPPTKGPVMPRASSLQPNISNVLADLKRATSARFQSSTATSVTSPQQTQKETLQWSTKENNETKNIKSSPTTQSFPKNVAQESNDRENTPLQQAEGLHHNTAKGEDQSNIHSHIIYDVTHQSSKPPDGPPEHATGEQNHLIAGNDEPEVVLQEIEMHSNQVPSSPPDDDRDVDFKHHKNATSVHISSVQPREAVSLEHSPTQALQVFRDKTQKNTTDNCPRNKVPPQTSNGMPRANSKGSGNVPPTTRSEEPTSTTSISRRERVRNRRFVQSSPSPSSVALTPKSAQTISTLQPDTSDGNPAEETPSCPAMPPIPNKTNGASSNTSSRSAARDRYARHKKLMHQRHQAST